MHFIRMITSNSFFFIRYETDWVTRAILEMHCERPQYSTNVLNSNAERVCGMHAA